MAAECQDRPVRSHRTGDPVACLAVVRARQAHRTGRSARSGNRIAYRVRNQAGACRQPRAAEAATRADGAAVAADAAAVAQQDRNARFDRGHLADGIGHRHPERVVPAWSGNRQGVLRREADRAAYGGDLPPVRRLRQRCRLAAARGDHDHARHLAAAEERQDRPERQDRLEQCARARRNGEDLPLPRRG